MIRHIGKEGPGFGLATRCLAWSNGEINTAELFSSIRQECEKIDKFYVSPISAKTPEPVGQSTAATLQ